jgi:hypothetical protein
VNRDAIDLDVCFYLDDVADLGAREQQRAVEVALWLAGAGRPPRPRAVRARARELDIHPDRHDVNLSPHAGRLTRRC